MLEHGVTNPAQRDDPVGVEREQADGEREHKQSVGDLLAEAAAGRPRGVDVLGVRVAGQRRELGDVRLPDGAALGREPLARLQGVEVAREEAHAAGASVSRNLVRSARRKAAAARRCPSGDGWKPSSA